MHKIKSHILRLGFLFTLAILPFSFSNLNAAQQTQQVGTDNSEIAHGGGGHGGGGGGGHMGGGGGGHWGGGGGGGHWNHGGGHWDGHHGDWDGGGWGSYGGGWGYPYYYGGYDSYPYYYYNSPDYNNLYTPYYYDGGY